MPIPRHAAASRIAPDGGVDPQTFRDVCGRFATGVAAITSFGPEGPSGMTANAVASLSLEPPLVVVCFDRTSRTLAAVEHSRHFGINFLSHEQEPLAAIFASKRPEPEKFAEIDWSERSRVPALDGCIGGIACELRELLPGGDHLIGDRRGDRRLVGARRAAGLLQGQLLDARGSCRGPCGGGSGA